MQKNQHRICRTSALHKEKTRFILTGQIFKAELFRLQNGCAAIAFILVFAIWYHAELFRFLFTRHHYITLIHPKRTTCSLIHAYLHLFFCFFCLQMFGCGAVAQLVLSKGTHGMFLTVNFAFGFAATLGILVCGQISGKTAVLIFFRLIMDILMSIKRKHYVFQPIPVLIFTGIHLQAATWIPRSPLPCVCWDESAGGSFLCTSCFKPSGPFLVLQSYLACIMVRTGSNGHLKNCVLA